MRSRLRINQPSSAQMRPSLWLGGQGTGTERVLRWLVASSVEVSDQEKEEDLQFGGFVNG
jgi:hypothetical protein